MDSLRPSCSRIALAAASKSAKVLGLMGATCEITALVSGSTFSTALQHGQPTSKGWDEDFAISEIVCQLALGNQNLGGFNRASLLTRSKNQRDQRVKAVHRQRFQQQLP